MTVFTKLDGDKNVLSAEVMKKLYKLRKKLGEINTELSSHTAQWEKICSRQRVQASSGQGQGELEKQFEECSQITYVGTGRWVKY